MVHWSCKQPVHCTADCFYFSRNSRASSVSRETKHRPCIKDIIEFRWKNPTAIKLSTFVRYFPRTRIFLPRRNCSTLTRWRAVENGGERERERERGKKKETESGFLSIKSISMKFNALCMFQTLETYLYCATINLLDKQNTSLYWVNKSQSSFSWNASVK